MKLNTEELSELLQRANYAASMDAKNIAALSERVLKLEHKLNELYDMLTDFRVNQIMGAKDEEAKTKILWKDSKLELPESGSRVILKFPDGQVIDAIYDKGSFGRYWAHSDDMVIYDYTTLDILWASGE